MTISFADYVAGSDVAVTWLNRLKNKILAAYNSINGAVLQSGTVANSALAKQKAEQEWTFCESAGPSPTATVGLGGTSYANVDAKTSLNVDGASATFNITGWSFHCGNGATAMVKVAGSQLLVKVAGATQITIDLNSAGLAVGAPISSVVAAIPITAGQIVSIDYTAGGGAARYPSPKLSLKVTLKHCST